MMHRILCGLPDDIKISLLPVGHTKFSPDWCLGLFKHNFRRTKVGCSDDIIIVVKDQLLPMLLSWWGHNRVMLLSQCMYFEDVTVKTAMKDIMQMHHFHSSKSQLERLKYKIVLWIVGGL